MTLFKLIETEVQNALASDRKPDTPENRIVVLRSIKEQIEKRDSMEFIDRFKMIQALDSEISVQRVRTHLKTLPLF
jgi:hypothetical protein